MPLRRASWTPHLPHTTAAATVIVAAAAVILISAAGSAAADKPREWGSTTLAYCPVTGTRLNTSTAKHWVQFTGGQRLYVADASAADAYRAHPRAYWLDPFELPPAGRDGKRGLPDMQGRNVSCAVTPDDTFLVDTMGSARIMHKGGQCVYFCCNACRTTFWREPGKSIVGAGHDASSIARVGPSALGPGGGGGSNVIEPTDEEKGSGYGATFVAVSIIITAFLTVLAVVVVGKLYYGTAPVFGGGRGVGVGGDRNADRRSRGRGQMHRMPETEDDELVDHHHIERGYRDDDSLEDTDTI